MNGAWRTLLLMTHRWLGIAGCVLFVAWFFSGIVMMYARMPEIANEERLSRAPALDLSTAARSPADIAGALGIGAERLTVGMLGNRPVYRFGGRDQLTVYADTGDFFEGIDRAQAEAIASRFAPGHDGPLRYAAYLTEPDQWTLQAGGQLPIHRFALDDEAGTLIDVSEVTGQAVLRSTARERFWAWLGPVTHWLYFTPLRRNGPLWSEVVIWSSLAGCVMCITGLLWGLLRWSPRARYRVKGMAAATPYTGLMKWHHYAGLLFGLFALTWTYSGLLSMGPFDWFASDGAASVNRDAATGGPLRAEALTLDSMRAAMAAVSPAFVVRELEVMQFRGEPHWVIPKPLSPPQADQWLEAGLRPRAARPRLERHYVSAIHPERGAFTRFDPDAFPQIARDAMPGAGIQDEVWLTAYDGYYYDLSGTRSLPVLRVRYTDAAGSWLYLDPARGGIVQYYDRVTRLQRWLYQGLHSLDFPFIYFTRPLWDVVVIALSVGGLAISVTTLLPAYRRLRRHGAWMLQVALRRQR